MHHLWYLNNFLPLAQENTSAVGWENHIHSFHHPPRQANFRISSEVATLGLDVPKGRGGSSMSLRQPMEWGEGGISRSPDITGLFFIGVLPLFIWELYCAPCWWQPTDPQWGVVLAWVQTAEPCVWLWANCIMSWDSVSPSIKWELSYLLLPHSQGCLKGKMLKLST